MRLFVGLSVLFTIVPAFLYLNGEERLATHIFIGWWRGVLVLALTTAAMMYVIKPILNSGFNLVL